MVSGGIDIKVTRGGLYLARRRKIFIFPEETVLSIVNSISQENGNNYFLLENQIFFRNKINAYTYIAGDK